MAEGQNRRAVLISIHPRHAEKLLGGTKKVELRKTSFAEDVSRVVVYATAPTKAVVGWLEIEGIERHSPSRVWQLFGAHTGISRKEFRRYFSGHRTAVAIRVRQPRRLRYPIALADLDPELSAPQSYRYLPASAASRLWRHGSARPFTPETASRR